MIQLNDNLLIIIFIFIASFIASYFLMMNRKMKTKDAIKKGLLVSTTILIILVLFFR